MTTFLIASHNPNKVQELQVILQWTGNQAYSYTTTLKRRVQFPVESKSSYRANAIQKALVISRLLPHQYVLADDSGLELTAFPDWLGVTTARELVHCQTPDEYDQLILERLKDRPRGFQMICELACAYQGKILTTTRAILTGQVADQKQGHYSQGFDRILIPTGETMTLAELPFDQRINYLVRSRAIHQLLCKLEEYK